MKYLLILFFPLFSKGQAEPQDSVGYVQPWLNERGNIVWMNTMLMDIRNVNFDTLTYRVEFEFPPRQAPYYSTVYIMNDSLQFEPTLGLRCYAIKAVDRQYGQVWRMFLPNNRPLQTLLDRGFRTTRIIQTGQR